MEIKNVAIIGMGAVGTVYGRLLYEKFGSDFAVITGKSRKEKLKKNGIVLNNNAFHPVILSPEDENTKFDLVIFCVKNYQLEEAVEDVRNFVGENTVMLTLLNGVTARERILNGFPKNKVLYGLTIGIDGVRTEAGVFNTVDGEIQFGEADNNVPSNEVQAIQKCFDEAGIKSVVFPDMVRAIWKKWLLNVGVNQVTAITGAAYGKVTSIETNRVLFKDAMMEVVRIAEALKIDLSEKDADDFITFMSSFSPNGKTSMLQDVENKRRTEVDYFSGTVIEYGRKLNIPTPVNHVLYCIIKSLEALY